jgi:hypothetical protein
MTGYPEWNFPAFHAAAKTLRDFGYEVVSPAEIDLETGFDPSAPVSDFTPADRVAALRRDVQAILGVDGVALLEGWESSEGAKVEAHLGSALDLMVAPVEAFVTMARYARKETQN